MPKLSEIGKTRMKLSDLGPPEDASPEEIRQYRYEKLKAELDRRNGGGEYDPTEGMSRLDHLLVGAGRGFTDLGQGAKQLGLNVGASVADFFNPQEQTLSGLITGQQPKSGIRAKADEYNRAVADESAQYEKDLGDSGWATAGRIGSQIVATAPLGGIGATAKGGMALAKAGALQGAIGAGLNPVTSGDYFSEKGKQVAIGGITGGALNVAGSKLLDAGMKAVNAPRRAVNAVLAPEPSVGQAGVLQRVATGSPASVRKGQTVADVTGINLSPGQRSGGKAVTMAENVARGSVWTRDAMFQGDQVRARQMINAINRTAKQASPGPVSADGFAKSLQGTVKNMTGDLAKRRSEFGRQAYGAVERAAGGQKIVQTRATLDEIAKVVDEFGSVQGADAAAVAKQAEAFFNKLSGDGAITPGLAVRQLQTWEQAARTGQGLFEGVQDRTTAKTLAGRLSRALMQDMDDTANATGGTLGHSLRAANKGWREYSGQIDALEASALGRIVGEDFADDVAGVAFNRIAPEKVWQRMDSLTPSELETVKSYIVKNNPDMWGQYQRLTLEMARDAAKAQAPSMGARPLGINPSAFVKSLEGSSGKQAVNQQARLRVIFGDSPLADQVNMLTEADRRMADFTGYNGSGTGGATELMQAPGLLGKVTQGAQATAGALGPLFGMRGVANAARAPINQRAIPMLSRPKLPATVGSRLLPGAAIQPQQWLLRPPEQE